MDNNPWNNAGSGSGSTPPDSPDTHGTGGYGGSTGGADPADASGSSGGAGSSDIGGSSSGSSGTGSSGTGGTSDAGGSSGGSGAGSGSAVGVLRGGACFLARRRGLICRGSRITMWLFECLLKHLAGALAGLLHLFPDDLLDLLPQLRHNGLEYLC